MMKIKILIILGILILLIIFLFNFANFLEEKETNISESYVGPVPEGYDEEHFRKTGETRRLENG